MPVAPLLPPDQMAQAQAGAGLNPANFLIAAADMHNSGALPSAPVPQGKALGGPAKRPKRRLPDIKVVR